MNAIEFIVIQDMTMNDTALYADILLPACHWFETEDLRVRYYCNPLSAVEREGRRAAVRKQARF